jgi:hypothetical protein
MKLNVVGWNNEVEFETKLKALNGFKERLN